MCCIIVLEDDVELNETMTYGLEKEGYRVISVHSREEAEKAAENSPLALAILDVNLPDGDGFQFCGWLKAKNKSRSCSSRSGIWKKTFCMGMSLALTIT